MGIHETAGHARFMCIFVGTLVGSRHVSLSAYRNERAEDGRESLVVAGLTYGEELDSARAEAERCRAALDIAIRGLSAARDQGFERASDIIADVNSALSPKRRRAPTSPVLPQLAAWARSLLGKA
jgi:hypothetical protein